MKEEEVKEIDREPFAEISEHLANCNPSREKVFDATLTLTEED